MPSCSPDPKLSRPSQTPNKGSLTKAGNEPASPQQMVDSKNKPSADSSSATAPPTITLPRWAVYVQAGLLGLLPILFFALGLLVGRSTGGAAANQAAIDCRVVGSVAVRIQGSLVADEGAVVALLPLDRKPDQRGQGKSVNPLSFQALDNSGISTLNELGGAIARVDEHGSFDVRIDANSIKGVRYNLLVISRHMSRKGNPPLTREQMAGIGSFFAPVEQVVGDRKFYWTELDVYDKRLDVPEIEF